MTSKEREPIFVLAEYRAGKLPRGPKTRSLSYVSAALAKSEGRREPTWSRTALVRISWANDRMIETVIELLD